MIRYSMLTCLFISTFTSSSAQGIPKGFIGCHKLESDGLPYYSYPSDPSLPFATVDQCVANCLQINGGYNFALFWHTLDPKHPGKTVPNCRCYPYTVNIPYVPSDPYGDCEFQGIRHVYAEFKTKPSYTFTGCWSALSSTAPTPFTVLGIAGCLENCIFRDTQKTLRYAIVQSDPRGDWFCRCSHAESDLLPVSQRTRANCDTRKMYIYQYPGNVGPSQAAKRREKYMGLEKRNDEEASCPLGLEACPISVEGHHGDYECVDTSIELESCGGCMIGISPTGVDCTALPGVSPESVLCSSGTCQVLGCEDGYVLIDGTCVS
ncbi:uncharacterized protein L199_002356 [Kwoniella botswanensis]|uniref:uncharacterized protein n=1 Tax=Kwoniella botswanensis TaxID=1268659 RepID=UPI00315DA570